MWVIDFEIACTVRTGKPIVGIRPWGAEVTPRAVSQNAKTMVAWNTDSCPTSIPMAGPSHPSPLTVRIPKGYNYRPPSRPPSRRS